MAVSKPDVDVMCVGLKVIDDRCVFIGERTRERVVRAVVRAHDASVEQDRRPHREAEEHEDDRPLRTHCGGGDCKWRAAAEIREDRRVSVRNLTLVRWRSALSYFFGGGGRPLRSNAFGPHS